VHTGDQDRKGEGLPEVVVGAGVQPLRLVELTVLRGQHQNRRGVPGVPQLGADAVAVAPRQHHVQQDQVVTALACPPQPVDTVLGDLDLEALRGQAPPQRAGDLDIVLDDQQLHPPRLLSAVPGT
jgi:hypothetical protein